MAIQETLNALGQWDLDLKPTIPREHLDALQFFGHVAVVAGRVDPVVYGDSMLTAARYVGVLRSNSLADDARTRIPNDNVKIGGVGMAMWLGDEDNKGAVIENAAVFASGSTFANVIRGLLPSGGSVTEGTLYSVAGTYSGTHQWQSPREAIQYVCDTMSTTAIPVSWRVNNNGTLDAGPESNLFVTTPVCAIVARGAGEDMVLRAIPGSMDLTSDVEDYTTRVVVLAEGIGASVATGAAETAGGSIPYKDIHGNTVALTRLVSESDTTTTNAATRAALALAQYTTPKQDLRLSIQDYDVEGSFSLGDYVWAYDPDKGLVDTANEIVFRGQRLNPIKLQVTEVSWGVTGDYTVAYRSATGVWTDLTDHVEINSAGTYVTVGGFARQLVSSGEPVGSRPNADTSIPGVPVLVEPFVGAAYLDSRGFTRARVRLQWNAPLNVDGSTVLDGDHYEIRYAVDTDLIYPATWSQVSQIRWADMQTWSQPFVAPTGDWQTMAVGWDQTAAQLQDLSPGVGYDVQIRAVDASGNAGAWSGTATFVATSDNIPPSTPAAPTVAASRIAVQITHTLGKSSGGTYNLESDLHHLEVHVDYEPHFTPTDSTLKGKVSATAGMIQAQIPVVATVQVEETSARYVRVVAVDQTGNKSGPSDAASATALLIDDAHISDLTVSKVTAGTIIASWVMAGEIKTADTGARARISADGYELYNTAGTRTLFGEAATGNVTITGELNSGTSGNRVVVNPAGAGLPTLRFYANTGTDFAFINGTSSGTDVQLGLNSSPYANGGDSLTSRMYLTTGGGVLETIDATTQARKGGYVSSLPNQLSFGYVYDGANGATGYMSDTAFALGIRQGLTTERSLYVDTAGLNIIGVMRGQQGSTDAVIADVSGDTAAGVATLTQLYAATMESTPFPMMTPASATSVGACWISSYGTASFTVTRGTTGSSFRVGYWAFRS